MRGKNIKITSTSSFEGVRMEEYMEPITAHVVIGMNVFKDFMSGFTDFFGGNSSSYQNTLSSMNEEVLDKLRKKAYSIGANCVVGLKIDNDEISAQGKSMMMVTAMGTAARADFVPKSDTVIRVKRTNTLSCDEFDILSKKHQYLEDFMNDNLKMDEPFWEFIKLNTIHELSSLILDRYIVLLNNVFDYQKQVLDSFRDNVIEYFIVLEEEKSIECLYLKLKDNLSKKARKDLESIIIVTGLLNYSQILSLLQNLDYDVQRSGLRLSLESKSLYEKDDLLLLSTIVECISCSFSVRGEKSSRKKMLSSKEKEVWICECGRVNDIEVEYCEKCENDIYGFGRLDENPNEVVEKIKKKINILAGVLV